MLRWTLCAWLVMAAAGDATGPIAAAQGPQGQGSDARSAQPPEAAAVAQVAQVAQEPGAHAAETEPGGEEAEHESLFPTIARIINAAILFGTLVYFLRSPLMSHLEGRQKAVRQDLVNAADLRKTAAEQLEELDQLMRKLPGEIELLKRQGAEEIAQEEARITRAAEAERQRLLEQTRREIDLQLRIAQRELIAHAAELAVGAATERIKKNITDQDQARLVDRYAEQLKK